MIKFKFTSMREPDPEVNPGRSITFVKITNYNVVTELNAPLCKGYAIKSATEPYNKALGQKYAIVDALQNINREDRRIVWLYFKDKYSTASKRIMR